MNFSVDLLKDLCPDELEELYGELTNIIDQRIKSKDSNHQIINRENANDLCCPECKSTKFNKNGKTKVGRQKYICKDCCKSFSDTTNTIVYRSQKTYDIWKKFLDCELKQMTLSDTAAEIGISTTCAFNWRHRLYKALENRVNSCKLRGTIYIDPFYTSINLKGTKPKNMPRYSKKRSGCAHRGLSHHKVCVLTSIDENDNIVIQIVGLGKETIAHYNAIKDRIENPKLMITDQAWGFTAFAKELGCELDQIPTNSHLSDKGNSLADINGIHSEISCYFHKYRGVSIRHAQGYYYMFIFKKILKYQFEYKHRLKETFITSIPENVSMRNSDIHKKIIPIDLKVAYGEYQYGIFA